MVAAMLLQAGYVLHRQAYRDTSLLVELFTPQAGRVGAVARGARGRRSRVAALIHPFTPLWVNWSGRGELVTLNQVEARALESPAAPFVPLTGDGLWCGFYVNELLIRLLIRHDPHPRLFAAYETVLMALAVSTPTASTQTLNQQTALRRFELCLLSELGYGLNLSHDADSGQALDPQQRYYYRPGHGPVRVTHAQRGVAGASFLALAADQWQDQGVLHDAKHILRPVLDALLEGRPLRSRALWRQMHGLNSAGG